jgi:hypothetical protein
LNYTCIEHKAMRIKVYSFNINVYLILISKYHISNTRPSILYNNNLGVVYIKLNFYKNFKYSQFKCYNRINESTDCSQYNNNNWTKQ